MQSGPALSAVAASQQSSEFSVVLISENVRGAVARCARPDIAVKAASAAWICRGQPPLVEIFNGPHRYGSCRHMTVPGMKITGDTAHQRGVQYGDGVDIHHVRPNFRLWRVLPKCLLQTFG